MKTGTRIGRGDLVGITAIAVTYVYFLLYAQFGFVGYLKIFFPDPLHTEKCMGAMGAGGLLFSMLAAVLLRRRSPRKIMAIAFAGCAAVALLTLSYHSFPLFLSAAFFIGGFAGLLTVTLAASLRSWIPGPRFGLAVGFGTGIAYFICNIPALFDATPAAQTLFTAMICIPGIWCALHAPGSTELGEPWTPVLAQENFRGTGFVSIVIMFLALVWLDSTAFATIQLTDTLRVHTWGTPTMKFMLGLFHAVAAVAAGWLIDRKCLRGLLAGSFGLFALAFSLLQSDTLASWSSGPLYAMGISVYSTALVAFPSLHPDQPGLVPLRWRAAILYAVAGWIGSGLGVGLAQHLHSIPVILLIVAALCIGAGMILPMDETRRGWIKSYLPAIAIGFAGMLLYLHDAWDSSPRPDQPPSIALGRLVYKQEGCINCHSQYLRPRSPDVLMWGPYRRMDRSELPPMVGNRRQGPDLMNAGLRRSALWHRRHLIDPASLSPGSKMPSYAYLFRGDDSRGESLVMYLSSLGVDHAAERVSQIQAWKPDSPDETPSIDRGEKIFETYCSMCHGAKGRADGPLSVIFNQPAMNLAKGPFAYVPETLSEADQELALARIVKFGLMGLHMPGHEYFDDQTVLDVVSYVRMLSSAEMERP